jgi:hypothetical protein
MESKIKLSDKKQRYRSHMLKESDDMNTFGIVSQSMYIKFGECRDKIVNYITLQTDALEAYINNCYISHMQYMGFIGELLSREITYDDEDYGTFPKKIAEIYKKLDNMFIDYANSYENKTPTILLNENIISTITVQAEQLYDEYDKKLREMCRPLKKCKNILLEWKIKKVPYDSGRFRDQLEELSIIPYKIDYWKSLVISTILDLINGKKYNSLKYFAQEFLNANTLPKDIKKIFITEIGKILQKYIHERRDEYEDFINSEFALQYFVFPQR